MANDLQFECFATHVEINWAIVLSSGELSSEDVPPEDEASASRASDGDSSAAFLCAALGTIERLTFLDDLSLSIDFASPQGRGNLEVSLPFRFTKDGEIVDWTSSVDFSQPEIDYSSATLPLVGCSLVRVDLHVFGDSRFWFDDGGRLEVFAALPDTAPWFADVAGMYISASTLVLKGSERGDDEATYCRARTINT